MLVCYKYRRYKTEAVQIVIRQWQVRIGALTPPLRFKKLIYAVIC